MVSHPVSWLDVSALKEQRLYGHEEPSHSPFQRAPLDYDQSRGRWSGKAVWDLFLPEVHVIWGTLVSPSPGQQRTPGLGALACVRSMCGTPRWREVSPLEAGHPLDTAREERAESQVLIVDVLPGGAWNDRRGTPTRWTQVTYPECHGLSDPLRMSET